MMMAAMGRAPRPEDWVPWYAEYLKRAEIRARRAAGQGL